MTCVFAGFNRSLLADIQALISAIHAVKCLNGCCGVPDNDAHV